MCKTEKFFLSFLNFHFFLKKIFQNWQEITVNYCIIIGPDPKKGVRGSERSRLLIEPIWESQRMSPNHTILSARCPKLEVATKRFSRKKRGGPPSTFSESLKIFRSATDSCNTKFLCCNACEHKKSCFLSVFKKGQKRAFFEGSRKRVKNVKKTRF